MATVESEIRYFRSQLDSVISEINSGFRSLADTLRGGVNTNFRNIIDNIDTVYDDLRYVVDAGRSQMTQIYDTVSGAISTVRNNIQGVIEWASNNVRMAIEWAGTIARDSMNRVWEASKDLANSIVGGIKLAIETMKVAWNYASDKIWQGLKWMGNKILDGITVVVKAVGKRLEPLWEGLKSVVASGWEKLKVFGGYIKDAFKMLVLGEMDVLKDIQLDWFDYTDSKIESLIDRFIPDADTLIQEVTEIMGKMVKAQREVMATVAMESI